MMSPLSFIFLQIISHFSMLFNPRREKRRSVARVTPPKERKKHPVWGAFCVLACGDKRNVIACQGMVATLHSHFARKHPRPASGEQAPRSSGGVCEPVFLRVAQENALRREGGAPKERKSTPFGVLRSLEAPPGFGPGIRVLQTRALPLGHGAIWSGLRGSNPPPRPWQGRALPNELNPRGEPMLATRMGLEPTTSSVTG